MTTQQSSNDVCCVSSSRVTGRSPVHGFAGFQRLRAISWRALPSASVRERKSHGPSFLTGSLSPISRASNA
jgi:hypothetical protein